MWKIIRSIFTKDFWLAEFPEHIYAAECFDCKLSNCMGCKHLVRK